MKDTAWKFRVVLRSESLFSFFVTAGEEDDVDDDL